MSMASPWACLESLVVPETTRKLKQEVLLAAMLRASSASYWSMRVMRSIL